MLEAARYLGETLEPSRVYDRFHELLADSIHHDGVVVSDYDPDDGLIRCEYAWVDGNHVDPATLPPVPFNPEGGMQSRVIASGEPLLVNDVREQVKRGGTYYDVDRDGSIRKVPDTGPPGTKRRDDAAGQARGPRRRRRPADERRRAVHATSTSSSRRRSWR